MKTPLRRNPPLNLSPGAWTIISLAALSSTLVAVWPTSEREGMALWTFAKHHYDAYLPLIEAWNRENPDRPVDAKLLNGQALERRMIASFMSDAPMADLIEIERGIASRAFRAPLERVGFFDLTDRLRDEDLLDTINEPSFSPWMSRGRIFGLPHDVHPVLLAYRADIVEGAGIDVGRIETWEDFYRELRPLMRDETGDGRYNRYLLNGWYTNGGFIEAMIRQADGTFFHEDGTLELDSDRNAFILATLATWFVGPRRMCVDAPDLNASGHRMRLEGFVVAGVMADWLAGVWRRELPGLAGKVKLMPVPAWERGGRRTSVVGGTMIAITRSSQDPDTAWEVAKALYLSPQLAEAQYRRTNIITPVKSLWSEPFYHEPDPYFSGQRAGSLFIEQAPHVPRRNSTPYLSLALERLVNVMMALTAYAERERVYSVEELKPVAARLLVNAQSEVQRQLDRNRLARQ